MARHFRLTAKSQVTVPHDVRVALGIGPGDRVSYDIDGDRVLLRAGDEEDIAARVASFSERLALARSRTATVPLGMSVDEYMALVREPVPLLDPDDIH